MAYFLTFETELVCITLNNSIAFFSYRRVIPKRPHPQIPIQQYMVAAWTTELCQCTIPIQCIKICHLPSESLSRATESSPAEVVSPTTLETKKQDKSKSLAAVSGMAS